MSALETFSDLLVGRIVFPATNTLFNRRGVMSNHAKLLHAERLPEEVLRETQRFKLIRLLEYVNQSIPYYRRLFSEIGLSPSDIKDVDDLSGVPILNRTAVKENYLEMVDERLQGSIEPAKQSRRQPGEPIPFALIRKHKLIYNTTSGSTGMPTLFFDDGSRSAINWAQELRLKSWFGLSPGIREARFGRESAEVKKLSLAQRLRQTLWHQMMLPGKNLTDTVLAESLNRIKTFRPLSLFGITSALLSLAQYVQKKGLDISAYRPRLVITWAAPLLQHEERILSEVFQCPVSNIYGSREVGHVTMRCPAGNYHLNQESMIVEIEHQDGMDVNNDAGEILVTPLDLSPMPFIRYRIGDMGFLRDGNCDCGRSLQLVSEVVGRSGELFQLKNGRMISPNFWSHIFRDDALVYHVERFQVIYKRDDHICIRVVPNNGFTPQSEAHLKRRLGKMIGPDTGVVIEQVSAIQPLPSGKFQTVVNELDASSKPISVIL